MNLLALAATVVTLAATCAPESLEFRGVNGVWLYEDWQHAICELDVDAGVTTWDKCLDNKTKYLPCWETYAEWCDEFDPTICATYITLHCPLLTQNYSAVKSYNHFSGELVEFGASVKGVCWPDQSMPKEWLMVDWPDVCEGRTIADYAACCTARGGC